MAYSISSPLIFRFFKSVGKAEHGGLVEMPGQNLHPYRKPLGGEAAGYTHARNTRQAAGDGENIGEVHSDRVVYLLAQLECRERRYRSHNCIDLCKSIRKIARNQSAHLLCLQIIRIIIPMA